jgi:hypothetical protein
MEKDMKQLPKTFAPKGTGLPGLTTSLVQRTDGVAWYLRSDGYHEVFLIKTGRTFDGLDPMEYYPGNTDFGKTAWCIREEEDAFRYYTNLSLGKPLNERLAPERHSDTSGEKKRKIRRPQTRFYQTINF